MLPQDKKKFQNHILSWFEKHKRNLPWRSTRDPYKIFVSEVMLQQTQVQRVIPKYKQWLEKFPDIQVLAKAQNKDILALWSGLGYNRRALYLKKTAEEIILKFEGKFPQNEDDLMSLPGIGKYTARAILCFAFNKQVSVVDTNVRKVILTRIMQNELRITHNKKHNSYGILPTSSIEIVSGKEIEEIAKEILPMGKAYEWNQALMDYASARLRHIKNGYGEVKQSKFKDSDRYYRGQILKKLVVQKHILVKEIEKLSSKQRMQRILSGLVKEEFIIVENGKVKIKE